MVHTKFNSNYLTGFSRVSLVICVFVFCRRSVLVVPATIVPQVVIIRFVFPGGHWVLDWCLLVHLAKIVVHRRGWGVPSRQGRWWRYNFSIGGDHREAATIFILSLGLAPTATVTAPRSIDRLAEPLSGRRHGDRGRDDVTILNGARGACLRPHGRNWG